MWGEPFRVAFAEVPPPLDVEMLVSVLEPHAASAGTSMTAAASASHLLVIYVPSSAVKRHVRNSSGSG